ncbi:BatA domain-containing protein [Pontibacter pamirensis]|uniref:BatA domain-containing protein n=1 Tax=Pontibacter pamirensis TaxID=2562824 RepID=UPI00138A60D0|nr:BatA domain-containing protein [Pontibacter pamirensis]
MFFLASYWLFAASAILIPIAIHLWNKRQGKTVKMGSLRWLEASASNRWSSIKLHDVGLLLLRCLILLLLAVALAQPVITRPPQTPESQKAVYVGQELLHTSATRQQLQPTIDSLLQRGYRLHTYTPDFAAISQEQWQQLSTTADSAIQHSANYWDLLAALGERHQQPQDSIWLFTSDQQRHFAGTRPDGIPENIRWIPVASEATATWLQAAVQTSPDSLLLFIGNGTRDGITYNRYYTPAAAQSITVNNQQLQLQRQADTLQAIFPDKSISKVEVQTEPLQIAILADEAQQPEVRYLQAAISAISSYTELPIHITSAQDTAVEWVFWLRSDEVPPLLQEQVAEQGLKLWVQPDTEFSAIKASMATAGEEVAVHQLSSITGNNAQQAIWSTQSGEALLTVQSVGKGHLYRFRSGFSPDRSSLGQSAQLPELLLPLLFPQQEAAMYDVRALDEQQLMPAQKVAVFAPEAPEGQRISLLPWLVLAAFVLFLIERVIAGRRAIV